MILVRHTYQLRFGRIDQAVELFRRLTQIAETGPAPLQHHAFTDIGGSMYTFISELVCESLSSWEPLRVSFFEQPTFGEWFREFQLIVETGQQAFYTIENEHPGWSKPGAVVVHECYRALKWQIRPAVALLQRYGALLTEFGVGRNPRLLTDLSGSMFQAIIEIETDDLAHWEQQRRHLYKQADFQAWFAQLSSAVDHGTHDFYRVEIAEKLNRS